MKTPCSVTPTGAAGRPDSRQRAWIASASTPSSSSSGSSRTLSASPAPTLRSSGSSKRARSRAQRRARPGERPASSSSCPSCSTASPTGLVISITVVQDAGSRSRVPAITMPAAGGASSPRRSSSRAGALRPSTSRSESSTASVVPVPAPAASARSSASLRWRCADSQRSPPPSAVRVCGSHFAHSQSGSRPSSTNTPIVRSAGPWWTAAWQTSERAAASAAARSPTIPTTPPSDSSTPTGAARSPAAASASVTFAGVRCERSSTGGLKSTSPRPANRCRKSSCSGRRSHRRTLGSDARRRTSAGSGQASRRCARSSAAASPIRCSSWSRSDAYWRWSRALLRVPRRRDST